MIAEIEPAELDAWRRDDKRAAPLVVDVRERWELDVCAFDGARSLPLSTHAHALLELPRDEDIVVVCHHGVRSFQVTAWLAHRGWSRVHNLRGGLAAWADQVDPAMARY
ncbi:MAG TPA: rhodanese-like domain-containing protein [Casimicrobiaceae bacterium]|nr:rhodanese-like domain-containing protein [Casimicrobiaceae bacterium]